MKISHLIISVVALSVNLNAISSQVEDQKPKPQLTAKQLDLLNFAYKTAKIDGHKHPQYFLGIIMQESKAGETKDYRVAGSSKSLSSRVFGVAQLKLKAAIEVMKKWPEMWNFLDTHTKEELEAKLILDDRFNIRVASKYMLLMGINDNPNEAIASYNLGPSGSQRVDPATYQYTLSVKESGRAVEKYTHEVR